VAFTSDGSRNKEINTRIGKAHSVLSELYCSVVTKWELSKTAKLSVFKSVFLPILTCGHEFYVTTERILSKEQTTEVGYLRWVLGVTLRDKEHRSEIRKARGDKQLLLIERSQKRWFGHVSNMPQERLTKQVLLATPTGQRPRGRPRTWWPDNISDLLGPVLVLTNIAVDRDAHSGLLRLLPPWPSPKEKWARKWVNEWVCRPTLELSIYKIVFSLFGRSECWIRIISILDGNASFCENLLNISDKEGKMVLTPLSSTTTPF